jgi:hypothetical protein
MPFGIGRAALWTHGAHGACGNEENSTQWKLNYSLQVLSEKLFGRAAFSIVEIVFHGPHGRKIAMDAQAIEPFPLLD